MSWYNYPNATDTEGLFEFFSYVSLTSDGLFFPIMSIVIWFIAFVGVFGAGGQTKPAAARAFTFASFINSILGIMLAIMGFLAPKFMYLNFILVGVGIVWMKLEG